MKKHKDALSNSTLKSYLNNKYNKVSRTKTLPDLSKEYDMRKDGWRRKCSKPS